MSENITYVPFKPGMSIKSNDAVFVFVDGVSVETFQKDEDFRSGWVTAVVAGKVRVQWDSTGSYEFVAKSRLTRIEKNTWVLDHKPVSSDVSGSSDMDQTPEMPDVPGESVSTETPDVPVQRRSSRKSGTSAKAETA